jgi:uncharacterized membrane protein
MELQHIYTLLEKHLEIAQQQRATIGGCLFGIIALLVFIAGLLVFQ